MTRPPLTGRELERAIGEQAVREAIARYDRHLSAIGVRGEDGWPVAERRRG